MLKHRFYDFHTGDKYSFCPEFEDKAADRVLSEFLMSDVSTFPDEVLELLDRVLSGQSEHEECSWNACYSEIDPDVSKIYCDLLNDDLIEESCEVNTRDLRELVEEWCREKKKFLARHPNDHL